MADNVQRSAGRGKGYQFDRGGMPTDFGPFIGIVTNNRDTTRGGRLQVWIQQFGSTTANGLPNFDDNSTWRTVSYCPPFYGHTNPNPGANTGFGSFAANQQSYGMWFTPPDIGTQVLCFFVAGDPNQGFYTGCIPEPGINHMVPAVGASKNFQLDNSSQSSYFKTATQLPVTEINIDNEKISEDPRFFDQKKPVHSVVAGIMMQQGLITDVIRGPITSNSQRESPSSVYGISTPGKAIYQGGYSDADIKAQLEKGSIKIQDIKVTGRRGGHSIIMDDGNLEGKDNLVRIRTSKGHQITMSDDGDCFYITHANGQTWMEFGKQGTVDVFSTNSVNVRTQGTINLHADKDINMFAGGSVNIKSKTMKLEAASLDLMATNSLALYSNTKIGIKSDGGLLLKSISGGWDAGSRLNLDATLVNLNGGGKQLVNTPTKLTDVRLADTKFVDGQGWIVSGTISTIVTRAPTHEPYPYHSQGVSTVTQLSGASAADAAAASAALGASAATFITQFVTDNFIGVAGKSGLLSKTSVTAPIDTAQFLKENPAQIAVGSLTTTQVTGLMATAKAEVSQPFATISTAKGIGQYGFSASQLEEGGYLKPGTTSTYLSNPANQTDVLSSPAVWTGKSGVENITQLLNNSKLQSVIQNELMVVSLNALKSEGIISGSETADQLGILVQNATKYGVNNTVKWINDDAPGNLATDLNQTAKNSQYAIKFVDSKATELQRNTVNLGGFTQTAIRGGIDSAVDEIIGNPKVPSPNYSLGLYSGSTNTELTYTGNNPIEYDRINAERVYRGLSPLSNPRPPNLA
jgi:hypothetical protein